MDLRCSETGPVEKQKNASQIFLNRLNWKTNSGELTQIDTFQLDVYCFQFKIPLAGDVMTGFTGFIKELDMTKFKSLVWIWLWLYKHGVEFTLKFGWNPRLSFRYNLKHIRQPRKLNRMMRKDMSRHYSYEALMGCPIKTCEEFIKEREDNKT